MSEDCQREQCDPDGESDPGWWLVHLGIDAGDVEAFASTVPSVE